MDIANFIFQAGNLKRTKRSGWLTIGIKDCESVAEHSFRASLIAYAIAKGEGLGKERAKDAMFLTLLHDIHEARIGDLHRLSKKYAKLDEKKAMEDSLGPMSKDANALLGDKELQIIVKDADLLEMFFQAREYSDEGNRYAKEWLQPKKLITASARAIYKKMAKQDSRAWLLEAIEW